MSATLPQAPSVVGPGRATPTPGSPRRPDIEGLRALAVVLVMLGHAGLPPRAGFLGVDVFFVISGFLITGLLVAEVDRTGRLSWPRFLARRARRLLPAAALVLVTTAAAAWFVVPGLRRHTVGTDIAGSAASVVNWVLANRAVDYLAGDAHPSPVQHFWSLSVEEQFYLVWPLLLMGLLAWQRRRLRTRLLLTVLAVLTLGSLAWSVYLTDLDPARAYFVTTTRVWELGVGALLAVVNRRLSLRGLRRYAAGLGWVGLAAVLATAVALPTGASWPGWWALVPVLGTAALLAAGASRPDAGPARLLAARPFVLVGGLSYALYLWHWPVLVLGRELAGPSAPGWLDPMLVAASVIPAALSHRYVEVPIHAGSGAVGRWAAAATRHALVLGAGLIALSVAAGCALLLARSPFEVPHSVPAGVTLGAQVLPAHPTAPVPPPPPGQWVTPDPLTPGLDRPAADTDHCQVDRLTTTPVACEFGDPTGQVVIALVGDSKAMQWLPALTAGAQDRGWRVVTYGKSACPFVAAPVAPDGHPYPQCDAWNTAVADALARLRPDVVVTSTAATEHLPTDAARATFETGLATAWAALARHGARVVAIADNPPSPDDLDDCAARHPGDLGACAFTPDSAPWHTGNAVTRSAVAETTGATYLDLTEWICPGGVCPVVIGHVVVNRPGDHITATYAATLSSRIVPVVTAAAS